MVYLMAYVNYELLPEYSEKSQLTDLFLEHKFWGWMGLFTIFVLISTIIYFQLKIWDREDKLANKKLYEWKEKEIKSRK